MNNLLDTFTYEPIMGPGGRPMNVYVERFEGSETPFRFETNSLKTFHTLLAARNVCECTIERLYGVLSERDNAPKYVIDCHGSDVRTKFAVVVSYADDGRFRDPYAKYYQAYLEKERKRKSSSRGICG